MHKHIFTELEIEKLSDQEIEELESVIYHNDMKVDLSGVGFLYYRDRLEQGQMDKSYEHQGWDFMDNALYMHDERVLKYLIKFTRSTMKKSRDDNQKITLQNVLNKLMELNKRYKQNSRV